MGNKKCNFCERDILVGEPNRAFTVSSIGENIYKNKTHQISRKIELQFINHQHQY